MREAARYLALAALALAGAACVAEPDPRPGPVRAMEPRPNPPARVAAVTPPPHPATMQERVRRTPWLTRFWEELTPAQRRQVKARLHRARPMLPAERDAGGAWDVMGLQERAALVFGMMPARPPAAAPTTAQGVQAGRAGGG